MLRQCKCPLRIPRKLATHSSAKWPVVPTDGSGLPERSGAALTLGLVVESHTSLGVEFSHGFASQRDAVSIMHEPVEDGVVVGGFADRFVPVLDRQLAGDQGGSALVAVFEDFQQIAPLGRGELGQSPIVQNDQIGSGEFSHDLRIASVALSVAEFVEQPGQAVVLDAEAVAAGLVAERAADPGLARAGGAGDQQVEAFLDPLPVNEPVHQGVVESPGMAAVEVFDDGGLAQPGVAQAVLEQSQQPECCRKMEKLLSRFPCMHDGSDHMSPLDRAGK